MSRATKSTTDEPVMGLYEYLRKHPQNQVVTNLMYLYLGSKVLSESEWNNALAEVLNRKIIH